MKRILLASASIVAFAGAAAAEITFTGSAELGFNDTLASGGGDNNDGFYSDLDITAGFFVELDNGLTAAASLDLDDLGDSDNGEDYELSLTGANGGLFFGDTNFAAQNLWIAAGDMEADRFSEADGEIVIRGELRYGNIDGQISYAASDATDLLNTDAANPNDLDDAEQLSIGLSGDFGNYNVVLAYQEDISDAAGALAYNTANGDFYAGEAFGISVGTTFFGANFRLAYAENDDDAGDGTGVDEDSLGLQVSYPYGPVTATAYFVAEDAGGDNWGVTLAYSEGPLAVTFDYDDDQGTEDWGLEGSYDVGNGLVVFAGVDDSGDDYYVAGEYDLGSGAQLLVSYADDDSSDNGDDEIGAQDYQDGTTVELSFEF